ncbi:2-hydroxychromene-2-carboxylate isomerase [Herminiimonas fonticola]|uniref:2-hydroxychromene-2-carboxylate isomerase n=1 Tax=Herminiimonas fonticola TaxID=303380 RepID=A0A4R6GIW1_9BURK|nr:2-hydroxychromene-2-carboxylate isomerase [Herminiimonas fonticola]RBA25245.1 2-hydroxychromene-2-carboxylate isomerase [Herminiimonas fonticola]TDN94360.1 2-hydroxychromene-2-carboxylate isomerase [Herminiimonas fonticola]
MAKVCEYYFAPQSPWSYFGHERLLALAQQYDVQIDMKPVDLSKIFSVSGGLPLAKRPPQRQAYRLIELKRWSEHLGLPLNPQPKFFPVSGDPSAKLIIATKFAHGTDAALALTSAVMRALWAEDKNIMDADTLIALANAAGHDGQALLKSSETAAVQNEYEQFTNDAMAASVFGAPWYVVDGVAFWGQDRLDFVERAFQGA